MNQRRCGDFIPVMHGCDPLAASLMAAGFANNGVWRRLAGQL